MPFLAPLQAVKASHAVLTQKEPMSSTPLLLVVSTAGLPAQCPEKMQLLLEQEWLTPLLEAADAATDADADADAAASVGRACNARSNLMSSFIFMAAHPAVREYIVKKLLPKVSEGS